VMLEGAYLFVAWWASQWFTGQLAYLPNPFLGVLA
jgi:hypothetical protein